MEASNKDDLRTISRLSKGGGWFAFVTKYLWIMSIQEAVFLQSIINLSGLEKAKKFEDEDGKEFFMCTEAFLSNSIAEWSADVQYNYLKQLQKLGFIEVIRKGIPSKRWVHIKFPEIHKAITEQENIRENKAKSTSNGHFHSTSKNVEYPTSNGHEPDMSKDGEYPTSNGHGKLYQSKLDISKSHKRRKSIFDGQAKVKSVSEELAKDQEFYKECSRKLKKAVRIHRPDMIPHNPRSGFAKRKWSDDFAKLERKDGVSKEDIKLVLDWYVNNLPKNLEYMPEAFCGRSFRAKFMKIKNKMNRRDFNTTKLFKEKVEKVVTKDLGNGLKEHRIVTEEVDHVIEGIWTYENGRRIFRPKE